MGSEDDHFCLAPVAGSQPSLSEWRAAASASRYFKQSDVIALNLKIETDIFSQSRGGRLSEADLRQIQGAYLWLDYVCVPKPIDEHAVDGLAEGQLQYVHSIPTYVGHCHCNVILALVPKALPDRGSHIYFHTWLQIQRGWCRTKLWCHFPFARSMIAIVAVKKTLFLGGHSS